MTQYYKTQRAIPDINICSLPMPLTEEIDSVTYQGILDGVRAYLSATGLSGTIKYIVTTQGVPLKVRRSTGVFSSTSNAGSFDSDLCLLNSGYEPQIGKPGPVSNPYYQAAIPFSHSPVFQNIYLVTRLAGYTYNDIVGLINRASQPYYSDATFIFDQDPTKGLTSSLNRNMTFAATTLESRGFKTIVDASNEYIVNRTNVLGYVSWGSNDANWAAYTQKAQPHFRWCAKALVETYVSSSARSFADSNFIEPTIGWQSMIADLIHENGVTGAKGYVWEPYSTSIAKVQYLYDRWTSGYTLAESYYAASNYLGWMDVVIGDPKSRFGADGHLPVELVAFSGQLIDRHVVLRWETATESNNYGFEVQKRFGQGWTALGFVEGDGTSNTPNFYEFTDAIPDPTNTYRLRQIDRSGESEYSGEITVRGASVEEFRVEQNYPNPFNPNTTIAYHLPSPATVTIEIYALDGRKVATLLSAASMQGGSHTVEWDGTLQNGFPAGSGAYLYRITATDESGAPRLHSRRMTLSR